MDILFYLCNTLQFLEAAAKVNWIIFILFRNVFMDELICYTLRMCWNRASIIYV